MVIPYLYTNSYHKQYQYGGRTNLSGANDTSVLFQVQMPWGING
jgi:hypothetical protein